MKITALLSLALASADLVATTPVEHRATKASHETFRKATDAKDIAIGQQWYLDQQNRTENAASTQLDVVGNAEYQVQCATQQTIDADDFAKAKQELMDCKSIPFWHVFDPVLPSINHYLIAFYPFCHHRGPSLFTFAGDSPTILLGIELEPRRTAHKTQTRGSNADQHLF